MTVSTTISAIAAIGAITALSAGSVAVGAVPSELPAHICGDLGSGFGAQLAYGTVQAKIEAWSKLPDDWDGNDGQAPAGFVIDHAVMVLSLLQVHKIPAPSPYVAGDGEVGFRWQTDRGFASISFLSDKHLVGFVRAKGQAPFRLDEQVTDLAPIALLIDQVRLVA